MAPAVRFDGLATWLRQRRDEVLRAWREAMARDPELTTYLSLSRPALDDHIPSVLRNVERRLTAEHALSAAQVDLEQRISAAEHGMHRWQQGYDFRETMREWGHLQWVLLREVESYAAAHAQLDPALLAGARETLAAACVEGMCESASRYVRLQQAEAASRMRDLEESLNALQALEDERAMLLREAAHDLRGSVGVIANASALLTRPELPEPQRSHFHGLLQQRIRSMGALLTQLADLARLEAGQDPLEIQTFDAAARLLALSEELRPLASDRNLFLKHQGPRSMPVEGDPVKLERILQNLLLNALKATQQGGVQVRWGLADPTPDGTSPQQWLLCVEDTGPGLDTGSAGPLEHALKAATDEAHQVAPAAPADDLKSRQLRAGVLSADSSETPGAPPSGEGIGLSIVKRLCQVLGASLELETAPGRGTTFRIAFPLRYPKKTGPKDTGPRHTGPKTTELNDRGP